MWLCSAAGVDEDGRNGKIDGGRQREEGTARLDGGGVVAGRKPGGETGQWQRGLPEEGEEDRGAIRKREDGREWGKLEEGKRNAGAGGGAGDGQRWRWSWR